MSTRILTISVVFLTVFLMFLDWRIGAVRTEYEIRLRGVEARVQETEARNVALASFATWALQYGLTNGLIHQVPQTAPLPAYLRSPPPKTPSNEPPANPPQADPTR